MAKDKVRPAPGTEPFTTGFLRDHLDERFIDPHPEVDRPIGFRREE